MRVIPCEDGIRIRGSTDDELVAAFERHIRVRHPRLVGKLSREEILGLAIEEERGKR